MLLISLLIKAVSRGPVVFRQRRIGFQGQPFECLKFRTMHVGADSDTHRFHIERLLAAGARLDKLDQGGDPRWIPLGGLLRASGLDELPQLINVLRGEMSLVGPRPCMDYEYHHYSRSGLVRFGTLPGLTGVWQVCGKNRTTFEEMAALDAFYVRHRSMRLDLAVMLRTFETLFRQVRAHCRRRWRLDSHPVELRRPDLEPSAWPLRSTPPRASQEREHGCA